jgi:uncharacterized protein
MKHGRFLVKVLAIVVVVAAGYVAWRRIGPHVTSSLERLRSVSANRAPNSVHGIRQSRELLTNVYATLACLEVDTMQVVSQLFLEEHCRELQTAIPRGLPLEHVVWLLTQAAERTPYEVSDCLLLPTDEACQIEYASSKPNRERIRIVFRWAERYFSETGKLAFLIEDFGFEANTTTMRFLSFSQPLTVSLQPVSERSIWTAKIADHYQKEIVILLAMESKRASARSSHAQPIMVHHPQEQIVRTIADAANGIPNYTGFCNMGGSRLLEDTRATRFVLTEIEKRHGYFVDTKPTPISVVPEIASALGLPYRQVDVAVKKGSTRERIDELLRTIVRRAQKTGSALVRAPLNTALIDALEESESFLRDNGIRLVFISDILVHPE